MKNYYELEKDKLESKLTLEKEKAEKKYKKMVEEYEQKHKDEISQLEDENEQMRDEFMSMETGLQTTINQLQHDNDMKSKQLDNLEKGLAELKETSAKREHELNAKYESLSQSTRAEKDAQYQKIEQLQTENNKKEKTIMSLSHLKEQLTTSLEKREAAIEDLKREAADLKASFEKASEDLKKRYQELSSEYLEKKIGYEKSIALAGQEKEFLEKKVKEQSDLL
jgi:chromosome segregation ATPase